jgi:hypothetical protein
MAGQDVRTRVDDDIQAGLLLLHLRLVGPLQELAGSQLPSQTSLPNHINVLSQNEITVNKKEPYGACFFARADEAQSYVIISGPEH